MNWMHELPIEVRDYELDLQGIVNNAVYQNYLEHGRHRCIQAMGLDFQQLHKDGWDAVVVRAEIDYKQSLSSNDACLVRTTVELVGKLRFVFNQEIVRPRDEALIIQAKIIATALHGGRPTPCPIIIDAVNAYHNQRSNA